MLRYAEGGGPGGTGRTGRGRESRAQRLSLSEAGRQVRGPGRDLGPRAEGRGPGPPGLSEEGRGPGNPGLREEGWRGLDPRV